MPEIKLKGSVPSLDEVPESHRNLYSKVGDAYILGEVTLEDITGLRNTVSATRTERDTLHGELKKFKDAGVTLEEWNEYQASKDKTAADTAKAKGDWEAREAQIKRTNDAALKAKDEMLARTNAALHQEMIESRARAALAEAGGNELFLLPHVSPSLKIVEEGGTFQARVVDQSGAVRVNSSGNPMTISERVAELKSDQRYAAAFAASGTGGTGSPVNGGGGRPNTGGKNIMKRADFDKLSPKKQMEYSLAGGKLEE